jgi:hypothetical protein
MQDSFVGTDFDQNVIYQPKEGDTYYRVSQQIFSIYKDGAWVTLTLQN